MTKIKRTKEQTMIYKKNLLDVKQTNKQVKYYWC